MDVTISGNPIPAVLRIGTLSVYTWYLCQWQFPFTTKDSSNNTQKLWLLNLREVENICHSVPNVANITTNDSSSRLEEHIFTYLQYSSSFSNMPPYFSVKYFVYYVTILLYDKTLLLKSVEHVEVQHLQPHKVSAASVLS